MTVKLKERIASLEPGHFRSFYEDRYAIISFVESVPCIKAKFSGVPKSSDHYQQVQQRILESVNRERSNYCRLHMLTDFSQAGIVLEEDIEYYRNQILPQIEKAGIRYHAIVLPESNLVRIFINGVTFSTKKIQVEYFNTVSGASKWLKHR